MSALAKKYQGQVEFLFIYCREAHLHLCGLTRPQRQSYRLRTLGNLERDSFIADRDCKFQSGSERLHVGRNAADKLMMT